ncbi:MAG: pyruvate kinase [Gemmatimonadetes bacterium RBG_16_66_8]|nr:MAG: pyruvate kinase [Gemmatimonadetes bacterium RBG_16_66_8]
MTSDPRFRRTKIVATLGPATADPAALGALLDAGVDIVRVNSSHGTPAIRAEWMDLVRRVREERGGHIGLLVDLQGPRIRVGALAEPRMLEEGEEVVFAPEGEAQTGEIPTTYVALADDVKPGARILLDDGLLVTEVVAVKPPRVRARVVYGGVLKSNKGMNLPDVQVSAPSVTVKDRDDIALAVAHEADYIAVSFVRRVADLHAVRALVPSGVRLVAKIEKSAALADLSGVILAADAIMVARGDLGVELPFEQVPLAQKRIIQLANQHGRPVITATQMLESMIEHPRPTRAEASDVANAILDGTDAVMLSAETATGAYPELAVQAMARIIREIEREAPDRRRRHWGDRGMADGPATVEDAIALATCTAAEMLEVPLIVCFTRSGFTARKIAAFRPGVPIVGLSTEAATCRQLALVWGVIPELARRVPNYDTMLEGARELLVSRGHAQPGDRIVVTAGVPFEVPGTTNLLKVETV